MALAVEQHQQKQCVFRSGDAWFAVPAQAVREVGFRPQLAAVPHSDPVLAGLCHLWNEFLPVLSLAAMSGVAGETPPSEAQIVVLAGPQGAWGLLVDQIAGLTALETSVTADMLHASRWSQAFVGWATFRDQPVRVLDPDALYGCVAGIVDEFWTTAESATQ